MANYDGLTRNAWTGTWSPAGDHPIVLDTEIRGGLRYISGNTGDQLTDITGQRLQEGMLVYVKNSYGSVTGDTFYKYSLLTGESRNLSTGDMPNAAGNWSEVTFGGSISNIGDITNVSSTAPTTGQVLKWDGTEWAPSSDLTGSGGSGSTNVIAPVAFAFVDTTNNGSGTGISWSNWNSANSQLDFTFTTAQPDANYTVVTDSETFDDYFVGVTNKTTTGFRAEFYDNSQSRTPSTFSPFTFIVYASTPTQSISGGSGIALTDLSVTQNTASGAGTLTYNNITGGFDYTPPDLSSFLTTVAFSDLTGTPTTLAGYGITDAFDGDYTNLTNAPTIPTALTDLGITDGTSGQVLSTDGSGNFSFVNQTGGGSGGISNVVEDTTPELGGDLDVNGNLIVSSGGQNIMLAPDNYLHLGSGATTTHRVGMYDQYFFPNASPTAGQVLQANATTPSQLEWVTPSSGSGGATTLGALTDVSSTTPSTGQVLKWNGTEWAPATDSVGSGGGSGIALTDLSVTVANQFGTGNLTYNTSTGVFLFTPPDLSSYSTFSGNYSDLQGLPTLFSGDYADLTNTPATSDNLELSLTGTTTLNLVNGDDNSIIDSVDLSTITGGLSYNDLDDLPTLFSGNYNDLTNTPTIPSLAGYATQTYVQNYINSITSDNVTEGSTNLYFNDERVDDRVAALVTAGIGLTKTYDDGGNLLTIDLDNTAVTSGSYGSGTAIPVITVDAQGRITSATTATVSSDLPIAGDTGTDSVSLLTDTLTFTGGTGVTTSVASDTVTIAIGQAVGTTDNVTFNDLTVDGDLTVNGTLTSISTSNTQISDNVLVLNEGETGAGVSLGTSGIEIDRGTATNVSILYDETYDNWTFGSLDVVFGSYTGGEQTTNKVTTSNSIEVRNDTFVLAARTTDATETEVFLADGTGTIPIPTGTTAFFEARFIGTTGSDRCGFIVKGVIDNNSGTNQLIGANSTETFAQDSGADWSGAISAGTSNNLKVSVTGEASTTVDWTVFVQVSSAKR